VDIYMGSNKKKINRLTGKGQLIFFFIIIASFGHTKYYRHGDFDLKGKTQWL
jgi:hypothetical protein